MIYLCPCINNINRWTSRKFEYLIGFFGNNYSNASTLYNEIEEDESEFNWWTKYYGFKIHKVIKIQRTILLYYIIIF